MLTKSTEDGFQGANPEDWFNGKSIVMLIMCTYLDSEIRKIMIAPMHSKDPSDSYFDSYSHYYIHEEMLKDRVS